MMYTYIRLTFVLGGLLAVNSQDISKSINSFSIELLSETTRQAGDSLNVALSPYTVWSLLTVVSEGAQGNTLRQLQNSLQLPTSKTALRSSYRNLTRLLLAQADGVKLELDTALFANKDFPVKKSFTDLATQIYKMSVTPVNFKNAKQAANVINRHVARATNNRIPVFVNTADVTNAQLFLTSTLFFKGNWLIPFNRSDTTKEDFFSDNEEKIGEVDMMFNLDVFPYSRMENIKAHALELPYGNDRKMSLVCILPFRGTTLPEVLSLMSRIPFSVVLQTLARDAKRYRDEEVYVYLPRFKVVSDFNLNIVLDKMGIRDVFSPEKADLLGIFDQYLYLSRLIQRAEIEVNEEGTIATAAAGATFPNKQGPPTFRADRPFMYFVVDKTTDSIIFAGKVSNPKTLK